MCCAKEMCSSISKSFQLQFSKLLPFERVLNLYAFATIILPLKERHTLGNGTQNERYATQWDCSEDERESDEMGEKREK